MRENKALKAGMAYVIANYFLKGLNFLTVPIFSRLLSTSDYGIYNTFTATEGILYVLIGLAIHSSYKTAWYKYKDNGMEKYNLYLSDTMVLILFNAFLWSIMFLIFGRKIGSILGLESISLALLIAYSTFNAVLACYNAHIGIFYRYKTFVKISAIKAITEILLSIILIKFVFHDSGYLGRMIGTTVPVVFIGIAIVYIFVKSAHPSKYCEYLKWGIKYSLPIVPNGIGQVILSHFDRIMINKIVSPSKVGIYSFAYNIYGLINVTAISLDNAWSPWFFEKMGEKSYNDIKIKANIYVWLMLLFSCGIIVISPELIQILGDEEYWDAKYSVIPIVVGGFFNFMSYLPISVEYYYSKTKHIAVGTVSAAIINLVLNYFFIPQYGYIAASYTTLFTYVLYFVFHVIIAILVHKKSLFSIKIFSVCGTIILVVALLTNISMNLIVLRWIFGIVIGIAFVYFEEKNVGLINKIIKKSKGNSNEDKGLDRKT